MSLSSYWRVNKSPDKARDMANLLDNATNMAQLITNNKKIKARWKKSNDQQHVVLDGRPIDEADTAPIPDEAVDVVMGMAAFQSLANKYQASREQIKGNVLYPRQFKGETETTAAYGVVDTLERWQELRWLQQETTVGREYAQTALDYYGEEGAVDKAALEFELRKGQGRSKRLDAAAALVSGMLLYGQRPSTEIPDQVKGMIAKVLTPMSMLKVNANPAQVSIAINQALDSIYRHMADEDEPDDPPPQGGQGEGEGEGQGGGSLLGMVPPNIEGQAEETDQVVAGVADEEHDIDAEDGEQYTSGKLGGYGAVQEVVDGKPETNLEWYNGIRSTAVPNVPALRRGFMQLRDVVKRRVRFQDPPGKLDDHALWQAGVGELDLFKRNKKGRQAGHSVAVLIDVSGSVSEHDWVNVLAPMVEATHDALHGMEGFKLWAGAYGGSSNLDMMLRPGWPKVRHKIPRGGGTPSGDALEVMGMLLRRSSDKQKVIIHITDGMPNDQNRVRKATKDNAENNINTITIIFGQEGSDNQHFRDIYGLYYGVRTMAEVPRAVHEMVKEMSTKR